MILKSAMRDKLTFGFKCDMRNLVNFHPTTQKSEYFPLTGSFCSKYIRFEKKYRSYISFMALNSDAKFEQTVALWYEELVT